MADDPMDLLEYSVVYTDRAVNLMSASFQECMRSISGSLKRVYNAQSVALIPGSGTFAMEAVARQFGNDKSVLVLRNGFFSFRWSEIFDIGRIVSDECIVKARCLDSSSSEPSMEPIPAEDVAKLILQKRPEVVFAPQVETSTGILLPDSYLKVIADAVHQVGGVFVLDSIAAGTLWIDMEQVGIDVLITAPQKGWSGPACCGLVLMNDKAKNITKNTRSTSFSCNLAKWLDVMEAYEGGGFKYYTTLPTDSIMAFRKSIDDTCAFGLENARNAAIELGNSVRKTMAKHGLKSVATEKYASPTVVVVYSDTDNIVGKFKAHRIQIAGGVPFKCDEPADLKTFRIGLFGLDKLRDTKRCLSIFQEALEKIVPKSE